MFQGSILSGHFCNTFIDAESTEKVEEAPSANTPNTAAAGEAQELETASKANLHDDEAKEDTAGKVVKPLKYVKDEVCPDEIYERPSKQSVSVETQTLECGVRPPAPTKGSIDYYTLTYEDSD